MRRSLVAAVLGVTPSPFCGSDTFPVLTDSRQHEKGLPAHKIAGMPHIAHRSVWPAGAPEKVATLVCLRLIGSRRAMYGPVLGTSCASRMDRRGSRTVPRAHPRSSSPSWDPHGELLRRGPRWVSECGTLQPSFDRAIQRKYNPPRQGSARRASLPRAIG